MKVKVTLRDTVSNCVGSREVEGTEEDIKKWELAKKTGYVLHRSENNIAYAWIIEDVEIVKPLNL